MNQDFQNVFNAALRAISWADYKALLDAGVPKAFLARRMATKCIGADDIAVKNGRWERRFQGERAIVLPVFGAKGDIVDLVAFRTGSPRSFWLFGANGLMLGAEAIDRAVHFTEPLTVHETPLDWLCAEGEGVVILDWAHYWPAYFNGVPTIHCHGDAFGKRLMASLERPLPTPEILVAA